MKELVCLWMVLLVSGSYAQVSPVLPAKAGIYLTSESFMSGMPEFSPYEVYASWYLSEEDNYARGAFWNAETGDSLLPLVVCHEGECFVRDEERGVGEVAFFARMWEVGAICLYQAYRSWEEMVTFKAFNPATGKPFREGMAPRTREMYFLVMWRPQTNEHRVLEPESYEMWIGPLSDWQQEEADLIAGIRRYNRHMESMMD